ncbi:hypothetical protein NLG97_g2004 [Lecanicillium saksenae]|uniref:Uncharacterized protein n=1 Tax=Lecanicillium saksenae TaxID=468837 RepID=A0ACC1R416_9HYPO|nr:hypothetical protein NLG97_g2004 [Lecanicillium saksenae]
MKEERAESGSSEHRDAAQGVRRWVGKEQASTAQHKEAAGLQRVTLRKEGEQQCGDQDGDRSGCYSGGAFCSVSISSSRPSPPPELAVPRFVTAIVQMLADWSGCTDQNAERALVSGGGAEGRLIEQRADQAYTTGEG